MASELDVTGEWTGPGLDEVPTEAERFRLTHHGYGKNHVRLLYKRCDGNVHYIHEYKVNTELRLDSVKDYLDGNNEDLIATDTQKNTVYVLARQHGVECPENFALLLCRHFLNTYPQVVEVQISIEESPWRRILTPKGPHNHAFLRCPSALRVCSTQQRRLPTGELSVPTIHAGIQKMSIMKTTQTKFVNFSRDDFRTLPDADDRILATEVTADWEYDGTADIDFSAAWRAVRAAIITLFAGPPDTGVMSLGVQHTMYRVQRAVLQAVPQIKNVTVRMPNLHYLPLDLSHFKGKAKVGQGPGEVLMPVDMPSGHIHARLDRTNAETKSKL